jgi:AcrR family transcriptional regulator
VNGTIKGNSTRENILAGALSLFAARGYHGTSTRQIASLADISIQTLHHHIGSKQKLYNDVLERAMAPVMEMVERHLKGMLALDLNDEGVLGDCVDRLLGDLYGIIRQNPNTPLIFFRQWLDEDPGEKRLEWEQLMPVIRTLSARLSETMDVKRIEGLDLPLLLVSLAWFYWALCVNPAFVGGMTGSDGNSPEYYDRLKRHARNMTVKLLGRNSG